MANPTTAMTTATPKIPVAEFWTRVADPGHRYELVDGVPIDMDGSLRRGTLTGSIGSILLSYVESARLPLDVGAAAGFQMSPYTLRFPDVYVATWARMAAYDEDADGFPHFAPDVAIEIASSSNTPAALARKTTEYFANGTRAMWITDPVLRTVTIRRPGAPEQIYRDDAILHGDPEIPGFACPVSEIFAILDRRTAN